MRGTRNDAGAAAGDLLKPGEYGLERPGRWSFCTPNGHHGAIEIPRWSVVEHEDGTITVSPSIDLGALEQDGKTRHQLWHGWLRAGEWSEA